jgi:hypothetical protein
MAVNGYTQNMQEKYIFTECRFEDNFLNNRVGTPEILVMNKYLSFVETWYIGLPCSWWCIILFYTLRWKEFHVIRLH